MVSLSARIRTIALAACAVMGAGQTLAADYLKFPVERGPDIINKPVELGSGWYLRGSASWSNNKGPQIAPEVPDARHIAWGVDLGAGYKFNNFLRSDLTIGWNKQRDYAKTGSRVTCPYQLNGVTNSNSVQLGYLWDTTHDTCDPVTKSQMNKIDLMWNAYLDLGTWSGITPFVGAGAGVTVLKADSSLQYLKTSDGSVYGPDLTPIGTYPHVWVDARGLPITPQPTVGFDKQIWSRQASKSAFNLAWSLMGGVAYDVTPQLKTEVSYRYLNSGSFTSLSSPLSGEVKSKIDSHQVQVGFRYLMD